MGNGSLLTHLQENQDVQNKHIYHYQAQISHKEIYMYEWPKELDVMTVFVGKELEGIFFSVNTVSLHFDSKFSVTIMSNYVYLLGAITEEISFPIYNTHLISSIGSKVTKAELYEKKDIHLWFENGAKLKIHGSTRGYEDYSFYLNGKEYYI